MGIPWTREELYNVNVKLQNEIKQLQEENNSLNHSVKFYKSEARTSRRLKEKAEKRIEELENGLKLIQSFLEFTK